MTVSIVFNFRTRGIKAHFSDFYWEGREVPLLADLTRQINVSMKVETGLFCIIGERNFFSFYLFETEATL